MGWLLFVAFFEAFLEKVNGGVHSDGAYLERDGPEITVFESYDHYSGSLSLKNELLVLYNTFGYISIIGHCSNCPSALESVSLTAIAT
jgi:hypothetical protein